MVSVTNPPVDAMNNESLELIIHLRKETFGNTVFARVIWALFFLFWPLKNRGA